MLLDLDGTLADTLEDIRASANHVRGAYGLEPLPADAVRELVGNGAQALLRGALQEVGPFEPLRERAWALYREHHTEQCLVHVQAYPGVCEHLRRWQGEGRPMAVVTNKPASAAGPSGPIGTKTGRSSRRALTKGSTCFVKASGPSGTKTARSTRTGPGSTKAGS